MDKRVKKLWFDALLSGKYKQGRYQLRNTKNEYCCLGVLCDLYSKETGITWNGKMFLNHVDTLPQQVSVWAGFTSDQPFYSPSVIHVEYSVHGKKEINATLGDLNDRGVKFPVIAKLIKEQL